MTNVFVQLTPLRFLKRSAEVFPEKVGVVDGTRRITYRQFADDVERQAQAFRASGLEPGDRVAYLSTNGAELLMAHFSVALAGGVLVALNTRLSAAEVHHICQHSGSVFLVAERELLAGPMSREGLSVREVIALPDQDGGDVEVPGATVWSQFLARGGEDALSWQVQDEDAVITINYTSGTTGQPKGVMYTHRGAYLNALGQDLHQGLRPGSVYLWTLPMFHCNGWTTPWAVTALGGRHICLRAVRGDDIWDLIDAEQVTHLCGAPTVLQIMSESGKAAPLSHPLTVTTAGAPPSPTIIERFNSLGATVTHVYGLTETYGPYSLCEYQETWDDLGARELAVKMARQGVGMTTAEPMRVVDPTSPVELVDVPADGKTVGEIVMRGNTVMLGYFEDPAGTEKAFRGGWFHSGDLGVLHPDGYVQLVDRAKDVIISGGENISTIEVEQAIISHPDVRDVAVIGVPNERWGEVPKAFVVVSAGSTLDQEGLIAHVRTQIAGFKAPKQVEFMEELPKTATGKIRKHDLRDKEWAGRQQRIQG